MIAPAAHLRTSEIKETIRAARATTLPISALDRPSVIPLTAFWLQLEAAKVTAINTAGTIQPFDHKFSIFPVIDSYTASAG